MRMLCFRSLVIILALVSVRPIQALTNGLALTPPMG